MRTTLLAASCVLLFAGQTSAQQIGDSIVVTTDNAPLKTLREITARVPIGEILTVKNVNGNWLWVTSSDGDKPASGWIRRDNVTPYAKALDSFNAQLRRNPNARSFRARGRIRGGRGEFDEAIADFNEAIRIDPSHGDGYVGRANAWIGKDEYDKAITDCSEAIRHAANNAAAYSTRGIAWSQKNDHDKALADFDEAIRIDPKNASKYNLRAGELVKRREYVKAIANFTMAIHLDPQYAIAFNNRAAAWTSLRDFDKALVDYDEAIRIDPGYSTAYCNRTVVWYAKGDYEKAIADLTEAIRLSPRLLRAYNARATLRTIQGHYGPALGDLDEVLQIDPKNLAGLTSIAYIYATCPDANIRNGQRAVEMARKACELTDWQDARRISLIAAAYAECGDFQSAVKWQENALGLAHEEYEKDEYGSRLDLYKSGKPYRDEIGE